MSLKGISYLELWQPFCSAEQNCEKLVEGIIWNNSYHFEFGLVVQEKVSFKLFLIRSSGGPLVR